jgi:hypothetical protein
VGTWYITNRQWRRAHRRKGRRAHRSWLSRRRLPQYTRIAIGLVLVLLLGRLAWQGMRDVPYPAHIASGPASASTSPSPADIPIAWETDVTDSLDDSVRAAVAGNFTLAETNVDRAESILTAARLQSRDAKPDFFTNVLDALARVIQQRPDDQRLFDHVMQARISLAELRTWQLPEPAPAGAPAVATDVKYQQALPQAPVPAPANGQSLGKSYEPKHVSLTSPRELAPNRTFDAAALGGEYLDATLMPDTAEIFLPPSTRTFKDYIRVEDVTISGAAQTLDGIRWRDVTFIGTRLRYESGDLDLVNIHFVRCRFGLPSDERGARVANAIALGLTSINIE